MQPDTGALSHPHLACGDGSDREADVVESRSVAPDAGADESFGRLGSAGSRSRQLTDLGFRAGGLTAAKLHGASVTIGTSFAASAAVWAGVAFLPRSYPTLEVRRLRETYLTADEVFTRRLLLDTRVAMYEATQTELAIKEWLVTATSGALGIAVVLTVMAGTLGPR